MRIRNVVLALAGLFLFSIGSWAQPYSAPSRNGKLVYASYRRDDRRQDRRFREERREHRRHHRHHHRHHRGW